MIRAKLRFEESTQRSWNKVARQVKFVAVYDQDNKEDVSFSEATPQAELTALITNPLALEQLEVGKHYYITIEEAK